MFFVLYTWYLKLPVGLREILGRLHPSLGVERCDACGSELRPSWDVYVGRCPCLCDTDLGLGLNHPGRTGSWRKVFGRSVSVR